MTTDDLIEILRQYPGMPVFTYDLYSGVKAGQQHGEPDVNKVVLHPCIHDGRKALFEDKPDYGRHQLLESKRDGEPFEAIVIYAGEGRDKQLT